MNNKVWMPLLIAAGASLAAVSETGFAQPVQQNTGGYWTAPASGGLTWKNSTGLCWRAGYWTPAMATAECDADLLPKPPPAKPAPPPPPPPPAKPAPPPPPPPKPAPPPPPKPVAQKVTLAADVLFDFDKSVVKPEGRAKLDDLIAKSKGIALEVIIAIGHTDSIGSDSYNQRLSVRRAEAIKSYLVSKGVEANRIYTEGKGEKQPVASNSTREGRAKNRRVEIEVIGTRQ
jgi:OOP family OmpA-OmpF porin